MTTLPTRERIEEIRKLRQEDREKCHWGHVGELLAFIDAQAEELILLKMECSGMGKVLASGVVIKTEEYSKLVALARDDDEGEGMKVCDWCEMVEPQLPDNVRWCDYCREWLASHGISGRTFPQDTPAQTIREEK